VFIPKYRRKVMFGQLRADIREILRKLRACKGAAILEGAVCVDHAHLHLSIPPKMSVSSFMGCLKGKSALMIFDLHPELAKKFDRTFWAVGYYVSTVGKDEEKIRNYVREQEEEDKKGR
jgi:putative transposase